MSSSKQKIVILYSGGLDSLIMKRYAEVNHPNAEIICVYFAHGAPSEEQEIASLPDYVEVRQIDWLDENIKTVAKVNEPAKGAIYIPGRNHVFATAAGCIYMPDEIWLGALADENHVGATDKNMEFCRRCGETLSYVLSPFVGQNILVRIPFAEMDWTKINTVSWALFNGLSEEDLKATVTCYNHDGHKPCGECIACFKRNLIFRMAGFSEEYRTDPLAAKTPKSKALLRAVMTGDDAESIELRKIISSLRLEIGDYNS